MRWATYLRLNGDIWTKPALETATGQNWIHCRDLCRGVRGFLRPHEKYAPENKRILLLINSVYEPYSFL